MAPKRIAGDSFRREINYRQPPKTGRRTCTIWITQKWINAVLPFSRQRSLKVVGIIDADKFEFSHGQVDRFAMEIETFCLECPTYNRHSIRVFLYTLEKPTNTEQQIFE